jgi:hypothetical protein
MDQGKYKRCPWGLAEDMSLLYLLRRNLTGRSSKIFVHVENYNPLARRNAARDSYPGF